MFSVSGLGERYPILAWKSEYKQQVAILREIVAEHESNLVLGEPQLNWCDSAVMVSKAFQIISRLALTECPLLHGNIPKETDTKIEKNI